MKNTILELIKETEKLNFYNNKIIKKMKSFVNNDDFKGFKKYFKRITGATDWDLPDIFLNF